MACESIFSGIIILHINLGGPENINNTITILEFPGI